jgi:hypothetical protein
MSVLLALFTSPALCCIRDSSPKSLIPDDFALAPQSGHPKLLSALPWMRITRILASFLRQQQPLYHTSEVIESGGSTALSVRTPRLHCTGISAPLLLVNTNTRLLSGFSAAT